MKFMCLGYADEKMWEGLSERERNALVDECFAYDDVLRKGGHFAGGDGLESARSAKTLRWKGGKAAVTDGPFAETKEQIGGVLILEARDLAQAVELMSKHPGVRFSTFEIRPIADMSAMVAESEQRRSVKRA